MRGNISMASDPARIYGGAFAPLSAARSSPDGPLLAFFLLTYAVTWSFFIATGALLGRASVPTGVLQLLILPGVFAPAMVAIAMTARTEGRAGVLALLHCLLQWRVGPRWFVFAAGYMAAIKLIVALVHRIATGAWPRFGDTPWYVIVMAIVISTPFQAGEEIGWRGYALPRLAEHFGFARASMLLGLIWACWHLPLFFIRGTDTTGQSFPVYLLQITALSVAITWIYAHTNGSLLLTMLMHAAINNTKDIVPSAVEGATNAFAPSTSLVAWITVGLMWITAAYFLLRMPRTKTPSA
jgi:membrane protease YdiL (CAAX protease family)